MDLVLFGIQGSGKGTQAKKLAADLGLAIFEAGGALRAIKASGSPLGQTIASYIDAGQLVPHEIIMQVVKEAVCGHSTATGIIFDGIPRDLDQMRDFDAIMAGCGRTFRCIELLCDEELALRRILGRAKQEGRTDDQSEESIRKRMQLFHDKTVPVIERYRERGIVTQVNGDGSIDDVYARLHAAVAVPTSA